jgi:hypothetical protein
MERLDRRNALRAIACTGAVAGLFGAASVAESGQRKPDRENAIEIKIPASLQAEHKEIHEELVRLTKAGGKTGEAAEAVAKALHAHFHKEEKLAMPPLGLLRILAEGPVRPEMAKVVELTDKLKKGLPAMLKEHKGIVGALRTLAEAGKQENKLHAQQFAEKLKQHAKSEEEVLYPAAILVGEYVKLKLNK